MKTLFPFIVTILLASPVFGQTSAGQLLQAGMHKEEVEGELLAAIEVYQKITTQFPGERRAAATAYFRIALCHEKMGDESGILLYAWIVERYQDQKDIVEKANERLRRFGRPASISKRAGLELIDFYIRNMYGDPLTARSPDGSKDAATDWSTGNLVVKDHSTGAVIPLTHKNWDQSPEFAFWKVWSADGKRIAYAWYRGSWTADLRVISLDEPGPQVLFQRSGWSVLPCDWSADGKFVVAKVLRKGEFEPRTSSTHIASISVPAGEYSELAVVDDNARGFRISPDCRYLAYDCAEKADEVRRLKLLTLSTSESRTLTFSNSGQDDTPLWSADGHHLLFRTSFGAEISLMCAPIADGKPAGEAVPLDPQIGATVLRHAGVEEEAFNAEMKRLRQAAKPRGTVVPLAFEDDFTPKRLDSSWAVVEYKGKNVYGFPSFGRYSLESNPGALRYFLDRMATPGIRTRSGDNFSYWHYPSLELRRSFRGTAWELETKVTFVDVAGADSRNHTLQVRFNDEEYNTPLLEINRGAEWLHDNSFCIRLLSGGQKQFEKNWIELPGDTKNEHQYTCWIRLSRRDTLLAVDMSRDGAAFRRVMEHTVPAEHLSSTQQLVITGGAWFTPAGSYADWHYFRLKPILPSR